MPSTATVVTTVRREGMTWNWTRIGLDPERKFTPFATGSVLDRSPLLGPVDHPLGAFMHWMDPSKAETWRAAAVGARNKQRSVRTRHVNDMVVALAAFYNCLNIPWYLHRAARELYWTYISGRPTNVLSLDADSVPGWYRRQKTLPIVTDASNGMLPRFARRIYKSKRPDVRENEFVQTVGIGLGLYRLSENAHYEALAASRHTDAWYLEDSAINQAFSVVGEINQASECVGTFCVDKMGSRRQTDREESNPLALPFVHCAVWLPGRGWAYESDSDLKDLQDANRLRDGTDAPDSFRGDFGFRIDDGVAMKMSLGPDHYFQWLSDWIDLLSTQTFAEIVTSAREMTVYFNTKVLEGRGGLASAIAASADQYRQSTTADPGLRVAQTVIGTAGAALATSTYGISLVVAAAVSLGIEIGIAVAGPNVEAIRSPRDDLGRFKPVLERPWLGGSPLAGTADRAPDFQVPNPPREPSSIDAMVNPTVAMFRHDYTPTPGSRTIAPTNAPGDDRKPEDTDKGMGTGGKVLIGAALLGTLAKLAGIF